MAKNSATVMEFLNNLWNYALPKAKAEAAELQKLMDKEGKGEKLEAWDWWYYTEKLRKENMTSKRTRSNPTSNWRTYAKALLPLPTNSMALR